MSRFEADIDTVLDSGVFLMAVYGTLSTGYWNSRLLDGHKSLGSTRVTGYKLYRGGYPGSVPFASKTGNPEDVIVVELFEVNAHDFPSTWVHVDSLEGHPDWYRREVVTTEAGLDAWMYVYPVDVLQEYPMRNEVTGGDWVVEQGDERVWYEAE